MNEGGEKVPWASEEAERLEIILKKKLSIYIHHIHNNTNVSIQIFFLLSLQNLFFW